MSWNYRVCKTSINGTVEYDIREVYYDDDGNVRAFSESSATVFSDGDSEEIALDEIRKNIERFFGALEKDILDLDTLFED